LRRADRLLPVLLLDVDVEELAVHVGGRIGLGHLREHLLGVVEEPALK
jgi:hypothetical protein